MRMGTIIHSFFIKRENNHRYGCTSPGMALMPENYKRPGEYYGN